MNFIKFEGRTNSLKPVIYLNKQNLNINRLAYKNLGEPKRISIFYSTEGKAIKIEADETGRLISNTKYPHLSLTLGKLMPLGKYIQKGTDIFIFEDKASGE